jgi:1,4-dihydroxy-2-naphthoate octaprenyltransferase
MSTHALPPLFRPPHKTFDDTPNKGVRHRILKGVWRVADPKITLASVAAILLGASFAALHGPLDVGWLCVTVIGIFGVEAGKNASGDVFDWDSGADQGLERSERTPFSGGKRIIVDGLLSRHEAMVVAFAFFALATAAGLAIVVFREPSVLLLGVIGMSLAYFYHAPPLALSYRGWGELAVAVSYGPIIACGTFLVQRHSIGTDIALASVPLGIAVMAFLWINEFPDARADAAAGKRTLVVRLGRLRASRWFGGLVAVTYVCVLLLPVAGLPVGSLLGFIGLPAAVAAARRLRSNPTRTSALVPAQGLTLLSFVLLSLGASVGALLSG